MKKISVVILTYNSHDLIIECLSSIKRYNDIGDDLEIIVVDNLSKNVDKMFAQIIDIFGDSIVLIKNNSNKGYGYGNNVGIYASKAPVVLIMNPDVRLVQPVFLEAVKYFEIGKVHMLGMKQMTNMHKNGVSYSFDSIKFNWIFETIWSKFNVYFDSFSSKYMHISGAFFFIDKMRFCQVGCFDSNIFMYGEELDIKLSLKERYKDLKIKYDNKLTYIHLIDNRSFSYDKQLQIINNKIYILLKHKISPRRFLMNKKQSMKHRMNKSCNNPNDILVFNKLITYIEDKLSDL